MTRIWERLWLGGLADAEQLVKSNPHGITTVISLCEASVTSKRRDVNYVHLPIDDHQPVPIRQFYSVVHTLAKNIRWGSVLIHCGVGVSRAPSFTAAWMHCVGYRNIDSALAEIKRLRSSVDPSHILLESIRRHLG